MKYTNKFNLPQSIVDAIKTETYDLKSMSQSLISISQLINPPIIRQLTIRHAQELEEDISENTWRLLGSAVHSMLERTETQSRLVEERLNINFENVIISGKPDLYDGTNKIIHDYKITSAWSLIFKENSDKQWENQLNCYAWLYRKSGFPVEGLQIIAILRDWSKSKSISDNNYPNIPIQVIEIPIWSEKQQEEYIKSRIKLHLEATPAADLDLPICTPEERWASPDSFAVYKNANKTASRLCTTELEALDYVNKNQNIKDKFRIEIRKGVSKRCKDYCSVAQFCSYGKTVCVCVEEDQKGEENGKE